MNISFSATKEQVRNHRKFVTRRMGWKNLKKFAFLTAVEKAQGLKKGEHVVPICKIEVVEVNREPLNDIITRPVRKVPDRIFWKFPMPSTISHPPPETLLEGFHMSPQTFVEMFCKLNNQPKRPCLPETVITRILFDYTFL